MSAEFHNTDMHRSNHRPAPDTKPFLPRPKYDGHGFYGGMDYTHLPGARRNYNEDRRDTHWDSRGRNEHHHSTPHRYYHDTGRGRGRGRGRGSFHGQGHRAHSNERYRNNSHFDSRGPHNGNYRPYPRQPTSRYPSGNGVFRTVAHHLKPGFQQQNRRGAWNPRPRPRSPSYESSQIGRVQSYRQPPYPNDQLAPLAPTADYCQPWGSSPELLKDTLHTKEPARLGPLLPPEPHSSAVLPDIPPKQVPKMGQALEPQTICLQSDNDTVPLNSIADKEITCESPGETHFPLATYMEPLPPDEEECYTKMHSHTPEINLDLMEDIQPVLEEEELMPAESNGIASDLIHGPQFKPPLKRLPPIWCQSRQEICETFDWFKSYQGGVYFSHNAVKGYLLSAFSASRDQFLHGGRLIISHGHVIISIPSVFLTNEALIPNRGGKAESPHSCRGQWVVAQADDQSAHDKSVRALLANFRESRPIALVIDDKYLLFPYDLAGADVTYAVLGLYTITDAWAEYQTAGNDRGRVIRYKFAFRWCEGQGEPWWLDQSRAVVEETSSKNGTSEPAAPEQPIQQSSFSSNRSVKKVRRIPLIQHSQHIEIQSQNLYTPCALCQIKSPQVYSAGWACLNSLCPRFWKLADEVDLPIDLQYNEAFLRLPEPYVLPENLRDIAPTRPTLSPDQVNTTYSYTRGSHCRKCGRLSCRVKLECWECAHCKESFGTPGKIRYGSDFLTQELPVSFLDHFINPGAGIIEMPSQEFSTDGGMGRVQSFKLPHGRGYIQHIQANYVPGGHNPADAIFKAYQEQAYQGSLPFRRWPMRAHKCRGDLLTNYFSQNSGEPYHYVGGTANTIPFDKTGTAVVMARDFIQARILQSLGFETEFNEILSCAYMERQKMAFHSDSERGLGPVVAGLSLGAPALIHFRPHHKQRKNEPAENLPYHSQIVMSFVLRHGDVLVMNGAPIQDFYEHTVVPTNFRIAATARWIDPTAALPETTSRKTTTLTTLQPVGKIEAKQEQNS